MAGTYISDLGNLLYAGLDAVFNSALKAPRQTYYKNICHEKTTQQGKKHGWYETVGAIGQAAEHIDGATYTFNNFEDGAKTTIESKEYFIGAQATKGALKFDLYGQLQKQFGTPLVTRLIQNKEKMVADLYNDGFTNTGADGVAVFSNSHPLQNSVKLNDNLATGALTPDNLIAAKNMFVDIYDQGGGFFDTMPTHLLINTKKKFLALQILMSSLMGLELSNTKNVTQDVMPVKLLENPYIDYNNSTGVSPWFLIDMTMTDAGAVLQKAGGVELESWEDKNTASVRAVAREWIGTGFVSPGYGAIGSAGS
ncbi:MAG: hypothetical protein EOM48_10350 [Bacilli bacterium]|nr:hypothetical protein [Bacilli bacterium]